MNAETGRGRETSETMKTKKTGSNKSQIMLKNEGMLLSRTVTVCNNTVSSLERGGFNNILSGENGDSTYRVYF